LTEAAGRASTHHAHCRGELQREERVPCIDGERMRHPEVGRLGVERSAARRVADAAQRFDARLCPGGEPTRMASANNRLQAARLERRRGRGTNRLEQREAWLSVWL